MKKLLVLSIVFVLLAATTFPALAGKDKPGAKTSSSTTSGKQLYALAGYITAIDSVHQRVTVSVASGNRLVTQYIGTNVIINTNQSTRLLLSGGTPIIFSDLKIGQSVSSNGILQDGIWTASRITVGALLVSK